jgi:hypothetical protein
MCRRDRLSNFARRYSSHLRPFDSFPGDGRLRRRSVSRSVCATDLVISPGEGSIRPPSLARRQKGRPTTRDGWTDADFGVSGTVYRRGTEVTTRAYSDDDLCPSSS